MDLGLYNIFIKKYIDVSGFFIGVFSFFWVYNEKGVIGVIGDYTNPRDGIL